MEARLALGLWEDPRALSLVHPYRERITGVESIQHQVRKLRVLILQVDTISRFVKVNTLFLHVKACHAHHVALELLKEFSALQVSLRGGQFIESLLPLPVADGNLSHLGLELVFGTLLGGDVQDFKVFSPVLVDVVPRCLENRAHVYVSLQAIDIDIN